MLRAIIIGLFIAAGIAAGVAIGMKLIWDQTVEDVKESSPAKVIDVLSDEKKLEEVIDRTERVIGVIREEIDDRQGRPPPPVRVIEKVPPREPTKHQMGDIREDIQKLRGEEREE